MAIGAGNNELFWEGFVLSGCFVVEIFFDI